MVTTLKRPAELDAADLTRERLAARRLEGVQLSACLTDMYGQDVRIGSVQDEVVHVIVIERCNIDLNRGVRGRQHQRVRCVEGAGNRGVRGMCRYFSGVNILESDVRQKGR